MVGLAGGLSAARARAGRFLQAARLFLGYVLPLICIAATPARADDADPRWTRHRALVDLFSPSADPSEKSEILRCQPCHGVLLESKPLAESPAGLKAKDATAWYQRVPTYQGEQQDFHWRHMASDFAKEVMRFQCDTCHPGFDPSRRMPVQGDPGTEKVLRKRVNPLICVNCHGLFPAHLEGFSGTYTCWVCHRGDAARQHTHPTLNRDNILRLSANEPEVCYGCHGGRAWYAISATELTGSAYDWRRFGTQPTPENRPTGAGQVIR